VFIHDFAQIKCGVTLSAAQMGKVFRIEAEQVRKSAVEPVPKEKFA
jgi:hypothetical protein